MGSEVKEGDLLAQIDPTVYLARVDASRAQLRNLRAQLKDREAQLALVNVLRLEREHVSVEDVASYLQTLVS